MKPGGLLPADRAFLDAYRDALRERFGDLVQSITVFGSKARGEATEQSDLDLVVVIEEGDWDLKMKVADTAYRLTLGGEVVPSVHVITANEWESMRRSRSAFREVVGRDGVTVA